MCCSCICILLQLEHVVLHLLLGIIDGTHSCVFPLQPHKSLSKVVKKRKDVLRSSHTVPVSCAPASQKPSEEKQMFQCQLLLCISLQSLSSHLTSHCRSHSVLQTCGGKSVKSTCTHMCTFTVSSDKQLGKISWIVSISLLAMAMLTYSGFFSSKKVHIRHLKYFT